MILKSRRARLLDKIKIELAKGNPSEESIMVLFDEYEKDNNDLIVKLKKDRRVTAKRINGALKQTINAHGPITKLLIGSASKRIIGALIDTNIKPKYDKKKIIRIVKDVLLIGLVILSLIMILK